MKLSALNSIAFGAATLNINALSDAHGQIDNFANFWAGIERNKADIFEKEQKGRKNVFAIAGDWFMAGNVTGYKSNPDFNSQRYQLIFFNKFVQKLHKISRSLSVIFTPGNHEFDAGEKEFSDTVKRLHANIVSTNLDYENSPVLNNEIKNHKITKSKIICVADDKDPNLIHKTLFVGATPGNMPYYNKSIKGIKYADSVYKPQAQLTKEDVENSVAALKKEIEQFKKENPKGAVVVLDHFSGKFREELLKQNLPINLILGAHEHLKSADFDNESQTQIVELYQNLKRFANVKINFDDEGNVDKKLKTKIYDIDDIKPDPETLDFYNKIFAKDVQSKYKIPSKDGIQELGLDGLRYQNSPLANYVTDVIMTQIKKVAPDCDIFALNASAIRGALKAGEANEVDNTHLLLTLNGIKREDADIVISKVSGHELLYMICKNICANMQSPRKNPLMHYSGLKIDKTHLVEKLGSLSDEKTLASFIIEEKTGKAIELDKTYNLANVEKFFTKNKDEKIKEIEKNEDNQRIGLNAKDAFCDYFEQGKNDVKASNDERYY